MSMWPSLLKSVWTRFLPPSCSSQPRRLGALLERAVARVAVEGHGLDGIEGRDRQIEQAVIVEVFHHRPAGHVEPVDLGLVADVPKLADVELGFEVLIERDQYLRSTLSGYSPSVMWARLSSQRTSWSSGNVRDTR